jgi:uncharacterized protein (DUF488 family)
MIELRTARSLPFFTVGHSNRPIEQFVELLRPMEVRLVVDIRTVPRSGTNPQFNKQTLPDALAGFAIGYEHIAGLGGLRKKSPTLAESVNGFWSNQSFHNYADYALTPEFADALEHLIEVGRKERCAMMCSEGVWWRCHRRIVADYLIARGESVFHIMDRGRVQEARLTPGATVSDGVVLYPG